MKPYLLVDKCSQCGRTREQINQNRKAPVSFRCLGLDKGKETLICEDCNNKEEEK